tara:strand:+ start:401 stop:1369 length:969 start_codon:yes stop_codon:yes gene_type:complete
MQQDIKFQLVPENRERLDLLCGPTNSTLKQVEETLKIKISNRGSQFKIKGDKERIKAAEVVLRGLYDRLDENKDISPEEIHLSLTEVLNNSSNLEYLNRVSSKKKSISTPKISVIPKGPNQEEYLEVITDKDLTFGIGPAGTGKTYLAVSVAVEHLMNGKVEKLLLVRPAVEAGEKLGFLPGDLSQKIDPYLKPLYDALFQTLGFKKTNKLIETNVIEIAPLAFMRGRTLNNSFVILDESQNTTQEQMKMFLTRMGYGSRVVVTGDLTQIDLPKDISSGLIHALDVLSDMNDVGFVRFNSKDVIRHSLVRKIVEAYEKFKGK